MKPQYKQKEKSKYKGHILAIHNNSGARFYRLIPQLKWMEKQGYKARLETRIDDELILEQINWADIVIFQMVFSSVLADYAKKHGKVVIFECDDLIHKVPKTHYSYKETHGIKNQIKWWKRIISVLRKCDALIVTNKELLSEYGWLVKNKLVYPNYCDLEHWMKEYQGNPTNFIRLLWAGSTSHLGDLEMIKPVLIRILERYKNVRFIYVGMGGIRTKDLYSKFVYGDDIFEDLPNNRESLLPVPASIWPYTLASIQADIAIAPLEKNYFNKFKSQCKYLEYSINKIPAVYSKWFYTDVIDDRMKADTPEEWFDKISYLIENKKIRQELGEEVYEDVLENFAIHNNLKAWQAFIEQLYEPKNT